jgi:ssDNA-binding Zn-finger/Zn-ribbon topoisomerase 1
MELTICPECGKSTTKERVRRCRICGIEVCVDCITFYAVHKKTIYRDYEELIPICKHCTPRVLLNRKLSKMLDDVFKDTIFNRDEMFEKY